LWLIPPPRFRFLRTGIIHYVSATPADLRVLPPDVDYLIPISAGSHPLVTSTLGLLVESLSISFYDLSRSTLQMSCFFSPCSRARAFEVPFFSPSACLPLRPCIPRRMQCSWYIRLFPVPFLIKRICLVPGHPEQVPSHPKGASFGLTSRQPCADSRPFLFCPAAPSWSCSRLSSGMGLFSQLTCPNLLQSLSPSFFYANPRSMSTHGVCPLTTGSPF